MARGPRPCPRGNPAGEERRHSRSHLLAGCAANTGDAHRPHSAGSSGGGGSLRVHDAARHTCPLAPAPPRDPLSANPETALHAAGGESEGRTCSSGTAAGLRGPPPELPAASHPADPAVAGSRHPPPPHQSSALWATSPLACLMVSDRAWSWLALQGVMTRTTTPLYEGAGHRWACSAQAPAEAVGSMTGPILGYSLSSFELVAISATESALKADIAWDSILFSSDALIRCAWHSRPQKPPTYSVRWAFPNRWTPGCPRFHCPKLE